MTPLRVLILATACIGLGSIASADPDEHVGRDRAPEMTRPHDAERHRFDPVTRDQVIARAGTRFDRMDLDHDGVLSRAEFRKFRAARKASKSGHVDPRDGISARHHRLDDVRATGKQAPRPEQGE